MMMMSFNCCAVDDCQPSCLASSPTLSPDEHTVTMAHAKNDNSQLHQRNHVCGKGELIRGAHAELRRGGGLRRSSCAAASLLAGALVLFAAGSFGRADGAAAVLEADASDADSAENSLACPHGQEGEECLHISNAGTKVLPFGAVLGYAPGGVAAYSCDYNTSVSCPPYCAYSSGVSYRHQANGLYYGVKFQCVEFSRRWLIHVQGLTYGDVGMAYEIFPLREAIRVQDDSTVPWTNVENGQMERPQVGSLLIWNQGGEFEDTGHVAVVVAVTETYVRVAEQNFRDVSWNGRDYSRELSVEVDTALNGYFIKEVNGSIKGWKNLPGDFVKAPVGVPEFAPQLASFVASTGTD
jgi:hypothetical protein